MPHCLIEHSKTIDGELLMSRVFKGSLDSGLFDADDIKVRTLSYDNYSTGNQKSDFVHVVLKILSGRSVEQKTSLSSLVLRKLETLGLNECSITVEVVDMDKASYAKLVN